MSPNKPTTLREEWRQEHLIGYKQNPRKYDEVADWWLDKFNSHSTELLRKIEDILKETEPKTCPKCNSPYWNKKRLRRFLAPSLT